MWRKGQDNGGREELERSKADEKGLRRDWSLLWGCGWRGRGAQKDSEPSRMQGEAFWGKGEPYGCYPPCWGQIGWERGRVLAVKPGLRRVRLARKWPDPGLRVGKLAMVLS